MNKFYIIPTLFFLLSCSNEDALILDEDALVLDKEFVVDTQNQPNAYKDQMNYWHVDPEVGNFTITGKLDEIYEDYEFDSIPLVETMFDSDNWMWGDIVFSLPLYNPFREYYHNQFLQYIDVGYTEIQVCNMIKTYQLYNLAGYTMNDKYCGDCSYLGRAMGTYYSNTLNPQQSINIDNRMKGDTIEVYIRTKFTYDLEASNLDDGTDEDWRLEDYRSLRIIIDN